MDLMGGPLNKGVARSPSAEWAVSHQRSHWRWEKTESFAPRPQRAGGSKKAATIGLMECGGATPSMCRRPSGRHPHKHPRVESGTPISSVVKGYLSGVIVSADSIEFFGGVIRRGRGTSIPSHLSYPCIWEGTKKQKRASHFVSGAIAGGVNSIPQKRVFDGYAQDGLAPPIR